MAISSDDRTKIAREYTSGASATALAKKYKVSAYTIYQYLKAAGVSTRLGRPRLPEASTPELEALNKDILAGKSEEELRAAHGSLINGGGRIKRREPEPVPVLSTEQIQRVLALLGRLAEKRPEIFSELGIMDRLAKYPNVLLEVL